MGNSDELTETLKAQKIFAIGDRDQDQRLTIHEFASIFMDRGVLNPAWLEIKSLLLQKSMLCLNDLGELRSKLSPAQMQALMTASQQREGGAFYISAFDFIRVFWASMVEEKGRENPQLAAVLKQQFDAITVGRARAPFFVSAVDAPGLTSTLRLPRAFSHARNPLCPSSGPTAPLPHLRFLHLGREGNQQWTSPNLPSRPT